VDNFQNDLEIFKTFSISRPANVLGFISERFLNNTAVQAIHLSANVPGATYRLNAEPIIDSEVTLSYFQNRSFSLEANPIKGYRFKHWVSTASPSLIYTEPVYTGVMNGNLALTAVYEPGEDTITKPTICINEAVSSNQLIEDEFGDYDDYIELYNFGTKEVDIGGWYVSDDPTNRTLSLIPTTGDSRTVIPAKGRLVVWADEDVEQGIFHLGFKLSKDGEAIVLSKKNDAFTVEMVDSVLVPEMDQNQSFARVPDGSSVWAIQAPTWNSPNTPVSLSALPESPIRLYPTLVAESFHVLNASGSVLTIADLTGKILYRTICLSDNELIPVDNRQRGMYLVTVGCQTYKIIKK
jgi:hypothetical protein